MIIVCPSCATRYDIKAVLPPEGRAVRCARCSTVWRATPLESADEPSEAVPAAPAPQGGNDPREPGNANFEVSGEDGATSRTAAGAFAESDAGAATGTPQGSEGGSGRTPGSEPAPFAQPHVQEAPFLAASQDDRASAAADARRGTVNWLKGFRRGGRREDASPDARNAATASAAIPFRRAEPRLSDPQPPQLSAVERDALEEARQAIRRVFLGLGESPKADAPGGTAPTIDAPEAPADEYAGTDPGAAARHYNGTASYAAEPESAGAEAEVQWSAEDDGAQAAYQDEESASFAAAQSDFGDLDEGSTASVDPALSAAGEAPGPGERAPFSVASLKVAEEQELSGGELAEQLEQQLRSKSDAADEYVDRERLESFPLAWRNPRREGQEDAEAEEPRSGADDEAAFDPKLFREIEEVQEQIGDARRGRSGGLALAAAWGLFVCIASGLGVIAISYRDIVADALPGTAPLYRMLGMPVTAQPLIFESVQYSWTVVDGKAAILVTGSVFNRASRKVQVPDFFVTVKDADPSLDREYPVTLQVDGDRIEADDAAEFEIELLSPSPAITAVELELRNVR